MIIIFGFAAMTFAMWKLWKYKHCLSPRRNFLRAKVNECEIRMVEIEYNIYMKEEDILQVENLIGHTRRIHGGLILNGGFVEELEPDSLHRVSYDMIAETNAGNYLARRSFEGLRSTRGQ